MPRGSTHPASLAGKRILVTGAGTGIGAAIAQALGASGAHVAVHYRRSRKEAGEVVRRIVEGGGKAELFQADLTKRASREGLVPAVVRRLGGLDALVNNAGWVVDYKDFRQLRDKAWDQTFELNAKAAFFLAQAAWPHLEKAGGGRIVNISTAAVRYSGGASSVHYVASKAALEAVTLSLAKIGAPVNILVNAIRCGVIATDMHARIAGYDRAKFVKRAKQVPLGRAGQPEEVAGLVSYLVGATGAFVTGQIIAISGGD